VQPHVDIGLSRLVHQALELATQLGPLQRGDRLQSAFRGPVSPKLTYLPRSQVLACGGRPSATDPRREAPKATRTSAAGMTTLR